MTLINEYIWYVVGAAAFLGFVLAWLLRGGMLAGKRRRATVERDIAVTELEQVRSELDSLYAAQRKQKESVGLTSTGVDGEIRERDERIKQMSDELAEAKGALQSLTDGQGSEDAAAATLQSNEDLENAKSRNEFLEGRIRELEAKIHEMGTAPQAETSAVETDEAESDKGETDKAETDKLLWQVDYLKSRITALEDEATKSTSAAPVAPDPAPASDTSAADEELARLRWRNRYLEGRLAYFEERPDPVETDADEPAGGEDADEDVTAKEVSPAPELAPDIEADVTEADSEPAEQEIEADGTDDGPGADQPSEPEDVIEDEAHPADRVLEVLDAKEAMDDTSETPGVGTDDDDDSASDSEGVRPTALEKPNGSADDLTLITGIGPRIQSILNDHGIWHFSQIAEWSAENEAWIDRQLNFAGRVSREGWTDQARELAAADASS
ncbi:MAG: hypothetical protein WA989_10675 [Henriciella sp.]|uniref:hypothetical protein n=1 Tax=Henriciella sp. TaxID=1968823 RepID=UPI003C73B60D